MSRDRRPRAIAVTLTIIGIVISAYLTWEHARGASPLCLGGANGGCHTVALSPYAKIGGIPVAAVGLAGYVALLIAALSRGFLARAAGFAMALVAVGFSAYLTYLELNVIHAICQWCVASAVTTVLLLITHSWWLARNWSIIDE